jgi:hypothetical protein
MSNSATKRSVIHPEDQNDLAYWTRKWGVNAREINDAILETGSIRLQDIKNVLRKKGAMNNFPLWLHRLFRGDLSLHL